MDVIPSPQALQSHNEQALANSLVPDFEDSRMRDYLVLRSFNFSHEEAGGALKVEEWLFKAWLTDETFNAWVKRDFRKLQRHIGAELLRAQFMRNFFLQLGIDSEVLAKRAYTPDAMTAREIEDARDAAKRYTAPQLQSLMKVLESEQEDAPKGDRRVSFDLHVEVGTSDYELVIDRKAKARKLLDQFTQGDDEQDEDGNIIEGEFDG